MSSGDVTANRSSSPHMNITGNSQSQESMDSTQIPLPPSEAGSIRESEPMNIPEAAPFPIMTLEEYWKTMNARKFHFLQEVAEHDPYIPTRQMPTKPTEMTENVGEKKKPTRTESWERMLKEVSRHDEDMVKGWRDDIDTLLVFVRSLALYPVT
ncbi:hypothetical protein Moror_15812 [Moniliophthora roreri MCA 2997]|uniref:DUF6535 domain-containing protein n=1 Tax=Moniliophthora roreri (strain MCA 2997) TaxID=1381753 RepID=V2XPP3_MONRO|nr:hypothetical protein Moror_15812 [Moniliophthora roreri MCA 2997]